jgi:CheY-like chemotaxis protein
VFEPLASDKGVEFRVELADDLPASITTDPKRVEQILTNLLGNAIKFTAEGEVVLRVHRPEPHLRLTSVDTQACVALAVSDTGSGIAREHQERIFAPFEQVDAAPDRRYGGTGLGLSIARELASLLGGELTLDSTPGVGSTFTLYLPFEAPPADEASSARPRASDKPRDGNGNGSETRASSPAGDSDGATRFLIVEDDVLTSEMVMKQLAAENLPARCVTSAQAALAAIEQESFDCIILDLSLPDMDGLDLLQTIQDRCGPRVPAVVIYTARALNNAEVKRLDAYTEAIVLKEGPAAERLLGEIKLFARRLEQGLPLRRATPAPQLTGSQLRGKKVLVVDDDMRTVYALSAALRANGAEVYVADTGRVALDVLTEHPDLDAALMDIMMPDMDGFEAMRMIRGDPRFQKLPIIALTAKAMRGEAERCLQSGANGYLSKPVDAERLLTMLDSQLAAS